MNPRAPMATGPLSLVSREAVLPGRARRRTD